MFAGSAIIVFRECLEAALIIGIMAAATRSLAGRHLWILGGVIGGLLGAGIVAAVTNHIAQLFDGLGQELFNASILGLAVLMLAWHNIWMSRHAQQLVGQVKGVASAVMGGQADLSAIAILVGVAVMREGAETVLFLYGLTAGANSASGIVSGTLVGLLGGVAVGGALYGGLVQIPVRWFFSSTSGLILLVAAGMAGQVAKFLIQADLVPTLASPLWDTSGLLDEGAPLGVFLHSLLGYEAQPAGMQVVFYVATVCAILVAMRMVRHRSQRVAA